MVNLLCLITPLLSPGVDLPNKQYHTSSNIRIKERIRIKGGKRKNENLRCSLVHKDFSLEFAKEKEVIRKLK